MKVTPVKSGQATTMCSEAGELFSLEPGLYGVRVGRLFPSRMPGAVATP